MTVFRIVDTGDCYMRTIASSSAIPVGAVTWGRRPTIINYPWKRSLFTPISPSFTITALFLTVFQVGSYPYLVRARYLSIRGFYVVVGWPRPQPHKDSQCHDFQYKWLLLMTLRVWLWAREPDFYFWPKEFDCGLDNQTLLLTWKVWLWTRESDFHFWPNHELENHKVEDSNDCMIAEVSSLSRLSIIQ